MNRGEAHHQLQAGEGEVKAGKARGYAEGTGDRLAGKKDSVVGAVTGDREQQASGCVKYRTYGRYVTDVVYRDTQQDVGKAGQEYNKKY